MFECCFLRQESTYRQLAKPDFGVHCVGRGIPGLGGGAPGRPAVGLLML